MSRGADNDPPVGHVRMARADDRRFPLIVVGASVRALAVSARRAGWCVHAADLYADADLRAVAAEAVRVPIGPECPWPGSLEACITGFPTADWLYGGALENHPDLVDRLARARPLAGNDGRRLRAVRDPVQLAAVVRAAGCEFPATVADPAGIPGDGSFLVKPRAGGGGRGVARWHGGPAPPGDRIWQRYVRGRAWSAAFACGPRAARLYGTSRQLNGRGWCGARGFAWCGAVDRPLDALSVSLADRLDRLGSALVEHAGLVGLVGVDFVLDSAGRCHVIEVNPRPTASTELVERATGESVVTTHLAACGRAAAAEAPGAGPPPHPARWTKAVVFAERAIAWDDGLSTALARRAAPWTAADQGWPALADLPTPDTVIAAGRPALTVFAAAGTEAGALRLLRGRVATVRDMLRRQPAPPAG